MARTGVRGLSALARIVAARPVLFSSLAVFSTLSGVVADNALNRQTGRHVHPILVTRGGDAAAPTRLATTRQAVAAPTPRVEPEPRPIGNDPRIVPFPLVKDVQTLLAEQGYYKVPVDGRAGQATDIAIREFQAARGLKVDGMATPLLLTQIRHAAEPSRPDANDEIASLVSGVDPSATGGIGAGDSDLVRQIQAKLADARVADLKADGILGERTRAAIRTFQALESLDVTGEPSAEVLARLNEVGASASR